MQMLSEVFTWQNELEQADLLNRQIIADAVGDDSMLDDQGVASLNLSHIAYERNDLDLAESLAKHALDLATQRANEMLKIQAAIRLALIQQARGDTSQARDLVKALEAKIQNPILLREIQNAQALLSIRANDATSLEWWVKMISAASQNDLNLQKEREAFILARLRIAEGKTAVALDLLRQWKTDAEINGRIRSQVEALCLEALAYQAGLNLPQAAQSLNAALFIGHAKGFCRMFLDEGWHMAVLIQASLPTFSRRGVRLYAARLLHSFSIEVTSQLSTQTNPKHTIETLSQQEMRVLRLLAAGLSNADIAQELVVSTNTIKTQVKSIYRKLNVASRDEARQAARELKLLN